LKTDIGRLKRLIPPRWWHWWLYTKRGTGSLCEAVRYGLTGPEVERAFYIVSCERNAGGSAARCLESVYSQTHPRIKVRHLFVDDASTDGTDRLIEEWLRQHPDHNVEYVHQGTRRGGTRNTIEGLRRAPAGTVVVELNGDDWLPNRRVLSFLSRVYRDSGTWLTYNTLRYASGGIPKELRPLPQWVIRRNACRDGIKYVTDPLRTVRRELLDHFRDESLIDPQTGEYWEHADDQAVFLGLLELAGWHAKHVYRTTYVYNHRETSEDVLDRAGSRKLAQRIRQTPKYQPLSSL
jgi:glycosyltransferase involved in cell wall biosynthesis